MEAFVHQYGFKKTRVEKETLSFKTVNFILCGLFFRDGDFLRILKFSLDPLNLNDTICLEFPANSY